MNYGNRDMPHFSDDKNPDHMTLQDWVALAAMAAFCLCLTVWLPVLAAAMAP